MSTFPDCGGSIPLGTGCGNCLQCKIVLRAIQEPEELEGFWIIKEMYFYDPETRKMLLQFKAQTSNDRHLDITMECGSQELHDKKFFTLNIFAGLTRLLQTLQEKDIPFDSCIIPSYARDNNISYQRCHNMPLSVMQDQDAFAEWYEAHPRLQFTG